MATKNKAVEVGDEVIIRGRVSRVNEDGTVSFWLPGYEYPITVLPGAFEQIIKAPRERKP
ncbi:hypothetical protein [Sinorhizobium meliloti]|uniref:hypothetical protein n=1 Tax=Rhizobium meliloti TaxID=382 RepID=UPI000FDAB7B4|nr:hypothetical protein [Sinorhizobium meliloti]MDX0141059.1 hypothetical protein [Sinorhizobium meliloti]MDX0384398.1 hypothetical protein [Sinorhizobium meliloti]RVI70807.1 hypothetical protein CN191_30055 [Sinorhizobium meliloti]